MSRSLGRGPRRTMNKSSDPPSSRGCVLESRRIRKGRSGDVSPDVPQCLAPSHAAGESEATEVSGLGRELGDRDCERRDDGPERPPPRELGHRLYTDGRADLSDTRRQDDARTSSPADRGGSPYSEVVEYGRTSGRHSPGRHRVGQVVWSVDNRSVSKITRDTIQSRFDPGMTERYRMCQRALRTASLRR